MGKSGLKRSIDKTSPEWLYGEWGRNVAAEVLRRSTWMTIDLDKIETGMAPVLEAEHAFYTLPDIAASKHGHLRFVEVKTKEKSPRFNNWGRKVHGIPVRQWNNYWAVAKETGAEVWIFVVEEERALLLGETLTRLAEPMLCRPGDGLMDGEEYIYFDRRAFSVLCEINRSNELPILTNTIADIRWKLPFGSGRMVAY